MQVLTTEIFYIPYKENVNEQNAEKNNRIELPAKTFQF